MKIIHCADIHLDSPLTSIFSSDKAKKRNDEILTTFLQMIEFAAKSNINVILISGDLFDSNIITRSTKLSVRETVSAHPDINFFYLAGNHDENTEDLFSDGKPSNLYLFGNTWKSYRLSNGIVITGAELNQYNHFSLYSTLKLKAQDFNIVMLHGQITNTTVDQAESIDLKELSYKNIDYLALGHIHKHMEGTLEPHGTYCYPGCLEGRGYDEAGIHGFELLDIDSESKTLRKQFIPLAKRTIHVIKVNITGCNNTEQMIYKINNSLNDSNIREQDMVKIILRGELNVEFEKNIQRIQDRFSDRFFDFRIEDQTSLKLSYSDFENDVSLKGEFVRTVMDDSNLSDKEKKEIIRCGLQALNDEEISL